MVYPVNIVINDRNWYDSRIIESAPVVFQNVNYASGNDRSVNVVRQRYLQDWAKRIIPNSVREGVGLTAYIDTNDQINISQGYATVGGRFIEIPAATFDCSTEDPPLTIGDHYLVIRVESFTEDDERRPQDAAANIIGVTLPYDKSHNDLVLAKFHYDGVNIDSFEDYTAIQEWQASVLSPVSAIPDLTTGSNSILLRAFGGTAGVEAVNVLSIENDKTRFYLNAVFDDQTASTEIKLINNNGILETRNISDTSYLGQDILNLLVGGTEVIDSSSNLLNIGTINARIMGGNSSTDLIDTDSIQTLDNKTFTSETVISSFWQDAIAGSFELTVPAITDTLITKTSTDTLTNKTLTSPIITGGTLNGGAALTADSTEINQIITGRERGGVTSGDIVDLDTPQTLENKILETLVFEDDDQSNTVSIVTAGLTGDRTFTIGTTTATDNFLMEGTTNTNITGEKRFQTDSIFKMDTDTWTDAQHTHIDAAQAGIIPIGNTSGTLATNRGGTGLTSFNDRGIMYATSTSILSTLASSNNYSYLFSSASGDPQWKEPTITLTGDVTGSDSQLDANGDWSISTTIDGALHTHDERYYRETQMDQFLGIGSANSKEFVTVFEGQSVAGRETIVLSGGFVNVQTTVTTTYMTYNLSIPTTMNVLDLYIAQIKVYIQDADPTDKVIGVDIRGMHNSSSTSLGSTSVTWDSNGEKIWNPADIEITNTYNSVKIVLATERANNLELDISSVIVLAYYA